MKAANANEVKTNNTKQKGGFLEILKKVLLWTVAIIGGGLILYGLYHILEILFVATILLIAWIGPIGWRWWR